MEETKKLNCKLEDNKYLADIFDKVNLVFAFAIILAPILTSLICLVAVEVDFLIVNLIIYLFFILFKLISFSLNVKFLRFRKLDILEILAISLFLMLIITEIINSPVHFNFIFVWGMFLVFFIFIKIDKKYYKSLMYTFILTLVVCSIMGVCDLNNSYMPGFLDYTYPMSLQFYHPNYSAYITTMAIMLCIYVLWTYKTKCEQIIFWLSYSILNVCLFINGCYSAEFAMFVGELFLLLYLWIKNKKCPWTILICMLISIAASFVWVRGYSTSSANFMFESLAVIDGKLGTNLVFNVSTFFDKIFGTGVISKVAGSDGWDRASLNEIAFNEIIASPKSFMFGYGKGYNYDIRVHNIPLQIWLEYGIINLILYLAIYVVLIVRIFKTGFSSHNIFMIALLIAEVFVCHYFGCFEEYSFTYFIALFAVFVKSVNEKKIYRKSMQKENIESESKNDLKKENYEN